MKTMEVEIISKKDNTLFGRQEIEFAVTQATSTPSRKDLREKVAAQVNADAKTMVIDVLDTSFGTADLKGIARVYKNEKDMKRIELAYVVKRNFPQQKEVQGQAAPAPATK